MESAPLCHRSRFPRICGAAPARTHRSAECGAAPPFDNEAHSVPEAANPGDDMKIAIVGTGAMGSVYAGLLGKAGHEVWAIDVWQEHIDAIASSGLSVSGASGSYVVDSLHVGRSPRDAGACDVWVIATKAADAEAAAGAIAPLLQPGNVVMAFQNGLGAGERVARQIPEEHILIGIAEGFGSSVPEPGHVHHEGMRLIRIGEMHGGLTERAQNLEETWHDAGFHVAGSTTSPS